MADGFGDAEVDDFGGGAAFADADEDVGWLEVAMDQAFVVGVLNSFAYRDEEFEAIPEIQVVMIAIGRNRLAGNVLHHEVGAAIGSRSRIKDLRDVGMVHDRKGLALLLESGQNLAGIHAGVDDFEGDPLHHRLAALGEPDGAEAADAEDFEEFVGADAVTGFPANGPWVCVKRPWESRNRFIGVHRDRRRGIRRGRCIIGAGLGVGWFHERFVRPWERASIEVEWAGSEGRAG